ncbi:MAG: hypothetical protein PF501_10510 [Salinisphaera sp.]|jgi:hypothetical protein|nr:hypothetical protein [Salinisphaera sp.]
MTIRYATPMLLLAASALLFASSTVLADSASGEHGNAKQEILLDPDTGDVTQVPAQQIKTGPDGKPARDADGYTSWQTKDGTQMIATDPSSAVKEQVVRCPDGSLRMGHASRSDEPGNDEASTLCARH